MSNHDQQPDIILADFEQGYFFGSEHEQWTIEGEAFNHLTTGNLAGLFAGYHGTGYANSHDQARRKLSGTLTSPEFVIERDFLCFQLAGWAWDAKTSLQLFINGNLEFAAYGIEDNTLRPYACDVSSFIGCKARLIINDAGVWEYIAVDDLVLSDWPEPAARVIYPRSQSVCIDKTMDLSGMKYLVVPINYQSEAVNCIFECDGAVKVNLRLRLATDLKTDYLVSIPVAHFAGRKLRLFTSEPVVYENYSAGFHDLLSLIETPDDQDRIYRESGRPQLHFTPQRGGDGDVVGLFYYEGLYHIFYLHDPALDKWLQNACWGHATSPDLFHWTEQPVAIWKELNHPYWSGGGIVDTKNASGLKAGDPCPILLFCSKETENAQRDQDFNGDTTVRMGEEKLSAAITLMYSTDGGRTFLSFARNPLFYARAIGGHDPKVVWDEQDQKWVMILHDEKEGIWGFDLYESANLLEWQYLSTLPDWWETPDMFNLPLDGDRNKTFWIVKECALSYKVGNFNGREFQALTARISNYAGCFAPHIFSNVPGGRCILTAALGNSYYKDYHDLPVFGGLAIPMELTLRSTSEGPRLFYYPVKEIETLVTMTDIYQEISIAETTGKFKDIKFGLLNIELEWSCEGQRDFRLAVGERDIFNFGAAASEFKFQGSSRKVTPPLIVKPVDGKLKIRIIADRSVVSFYINDGFEAGNIYLADFTSACKVPLGIDGDAAMVFNRIKVDTLRSPLNAYC